MIRFNRLLFYILIVSCISVSATNVITSDGPGSSSINSLLQGPVVRALAVTTAGLWRIWKIAKESIGENACAGATIALATVGQSNLTDDGSVCDTRSPAAKKRARNRENQKAKKNSDDKTESTATTMQRNRRGKESPEAKGLRRSKDRQAKAKAKALTKSVSCFITSLILYSYWCKICACRRWPSLPKRSSIVIHQSVPPTMTFSQSEIVSISRSNIERYPTLLI